MFLSMLPFVTALISSAVISSPVQWAAIFSTRLSPAIADAAIALSRTGARIRYTLVTAGDPGEEQNRLLDLLRISGLEAVHLHA